MQNDYELSIAEAEQRETVRLALARDCWLAGDLTYDRHLLQRRIKRQLDEALARGARRFVLEAGRKVGKTNELVRIAHELALAFPGCRIVYGAPTLKHLEEFVHPEFARVAKDAPRECKPVWNGASDHYNFPNGSWVHLFGAKDEAQAKNGRGPGAIAAMFDEAGFCTCLPVVLDDVFKPSLMLTQGWQLLSSSPSDMPEHPFTNITEIEEASGNYAHASWLENPMLTDAQRAAEIAENARQASMTPAEYVRSAKYRREYLGERLIDPQLVGVPEWSVPRVDEHDKPLPPWRELRIKRIPRPPLYRGQVAIDFGGVDPHHVVFGYWHPEFGAVLERELVMRNGERTDQLIADIKAVEAELWGVDKWDGTLAGFTKEKMAEHFGAEPPDWAVAAAGKNAPEQPWFRSRDTDTQLGIDLAGQGLLTIPTKKDRKQLAVDSLRVLINRGEFWLDPSMVATDKSLCNTTWANLKREEWARRADGTHGDGVDACVYFNRNLERSVPIEPKPPPWFGGPPQKSVFGNSPVARALMRKQGR